MKLGIGSDLHLNFLEPRKQQAFFTQVKSKNYDALIIAGDIGDANSLRSNLEMMAEMFDIPIYFILGNHDFYHGSVKVIREDVIEICKGHTNLIYLTDAKQTEWIDNIAVVGHDGWYDGEYGDYKNSRFELNDFQLIGEYLGRDKWGRFELMQQLSIDACEHLKKRILSAFFGARKVKQILIVTHVPPFDIACVTRYAENPEHSLPLYSCKMIGDMLKKFAEQNKDVTFTVLSGHTHRKCTTEITDNLNIIVFNAEYYMPEITEIEIGKEI